MKLRWVNSVDFNVVTIVLISAISIVVGVNSQSGNNEFLAPFAVLFGQPLIMVFTMIFYFISRKIKRVKKYSWAITFLGMSFSILYAVYGY